MATAGFTDGSRQARLTMAVDLVALPLFVVVGMGSHDRDGQLAVFARNAIPIEVAWLAVALIVRTYRPPSLGRMLGTWIIAVPVGLVIRTAIAGSFGDPDILVFFGVAMAFTLLFLGVGRAIALALGRLWGPA
jgi:hypothetical protein